MQPSKSCRAGAPLRRRAVALSLSGCLWVVALLAVARAANVGTPDLLYHSNQAPADARVGGMGGGGCALASGVLAVFTNPALIYSCARDGKVKGLLSGISYARQEPLYAGNVVTLGAAFADEKAGAIANLYRYVQGGKERQTDYQAMATYAGQMFQRSGDQGAVDYGLNVRYEQANWNVYSLPVLTTSRFPGDGSVAESSWLPGNIREKRLMFDIGFYQSDVFGSFDFGLVGRNVLGYVWHDEQPSVESVDSLTDSVENGDTVRVQGSRYVSTSFADDGWAANRYRTLLVGGLFHTSFAGGKVVIRIPLDLEFYGVFERGKKTHTLFKVGAEGEFLSKFFVRIGYARKPYRVVCASKLKNANFISGGLGFKIRGFALDAYGANGEWGLGLLFNY